MIFVSTIILNIFKIINTNICTCVNYDISLQHQTNIYYHHVKQIQIQDKGAHISPKYRASRSCGSLSEIPTNYIQLVQYTSR